MTAYHRMGCLGDQQFCLLRSRKIFSRLPEFTTVFQGINSLVVLPRYLFSERRAHFRVAMKCFLADPVAVLEEQVAMHDLKRPQETAQHGPHGRTVAVVSRASQCISLAVCCISTHLPPSATSCGLQTFSFKTHCVVLDVLGSVRFYSVLSSSIRFLFLRKSQRHDFP